jgi:hypothetical protein
MPGPQPATSTTVNNQTVPQWVSDAGQANYAKAVDLDNQPLQQYAGSTVAPQSDATKQAFQFFQDHMGAGGVDTAKASEIFKNMSDPSSFAGGVNSFLNPYIQNVEDKAIGALNDQRIQTLMGNADSAIKAKAFGGSREAITNGVTNAQSAKDAGLLSAQLRSAGYTDAANRYQQSQTTAGQGLLSTGDQEFSQMLKDFAGMQSIGQQQDTHDQAVRTADVAKFNEQRDKELNDLNVRMAALGMTPYDKTSTTNSTSTPGSPGTDWGALGIGGLSILAGLL